jgi:LAO/AO transport system kinase
MSNKEKTSRSSKSGMNPNFSHRNKSGLSAKDINDLFNKLQKGDRYALSKAITLIESQNPDDQLLANSLLDLCIQRGKIAKRIAISGAPGSGKSTFLESFGSYLCEQGLKIAVLAVDPSSSISKGSILADKTRMSGLAKNPNAFIRPTASATFLGGVAKSTKESITLCEAAGFDIVFIETVGVGQSEVSAARMVDLMLLIIQPGSGDSLQGIKRGIMELADLILINKADGNRVHLANNTRAEYENALRLLHPKYDFWKPQVVLCSALKEIGLTEVWEILQLFYSSISIELLHKLRREQDIQWFNDLLKDKLIKEILAQDVYKNSYNQVLSLLQTGGISVNSALQQLIKDLKIDFLIQ